MRNVAALGERAGRPLRKIVLPLLSDPDARSTHESRGVAGFDLDIGPVVGARDRGRLERLCRYLLRPPLATERLDELPDGRVKYRLHHAWRDGTTAVMLEPLELLERLAALVPAPMRHQLRYFGTLAPHAAWRSLIVPSTRDERKEAGCGATQAGGESSRSSRIAWADLLKRVFLTDVLGRWCTNPTLPGERA